MCNVTIEEISNLISIGTPFILLVWFYYSQRQALSKTYFDEIDGHYGGYTDSVQEPDYGGRIDAGIIMNIRDTDGKGFFKGEFDFGEIEFFNMGGVAHSRVRSRGIFTFMGKLNFELKSNISRHPFKPDQNRQYIGTLYIVDRLDFAFDKYNIETYLNAEYDILHYREMQVLVFTLKKLHQKNKPKLPSKFTLYKRMGSSFEPYSNVKESVFQNVTHSDA